MSKYAIVESGSCQYWVQENDIIEVERLDSEKGKEILLDKVLVFRQDDDTKVGNPYVSGMKVRCEVLGEKRAPKVIHYVFRRRKNSRRKHGHRQTYTMLKVNAIEGL